MFRSICSVIISSEPLCVSRFVTSVTVGGHGRRVGGGVTGCAAATVAADGIGSVEMRYHSLIPVLHSVSRLGWRIMVGAAAALTTAIVPQGRPSWSIL